jgi:hypothetical protein
MSYMPIEGQPGKLLFDSEASYSALLHEYQHFLDDVALENPGLGYYLENPDVFYELEQNAYSVEIEYAQGIGDQEVVKELIENMLDRRMELLGY